jgi:prepilin-type N-terminal cleavage/methylation domain-containing protein
MRARRPRLLSAFTLIEVLLAIGILAIGITSVLFLFTMGARSHRRAVDRTRAALLAETVINQIKTDLTSTLPTRYTEDKDGNLQPFINATHADFPEFYYDAFFTTLYKGAFYRVRVVVRWGNEQAAAEARNSETYESVLRRKNF